MTESLAAWRTGSLAGDSPPIVPASAGDPWTTVETGARWSRDQPATVMRTVGSREPADRSDDESGRAGDHALSAAVMITRWARRSMVRA